MSNMCCMYNEIVQEITRLRQLKRSVFDTAFDGCDMEASDICLSADVLLLPLYWYLINNHHEMPETVRIEDYMLDSIKAFESRADQIIPSILNRTKALDDNYKTQPFKTYRSIIARCFPQYVVNHSTK